MYTQILIPGIEPPLQIESLFFAFSPDEKTAARIAELALQLREKCKLKGRPLRAERFHVSLYHVGDYSVVPQNVIDQAQQVAKTVTAPSFELAFDLAASLPNSRDNKPFVLLTDENNTAFATFQRTLGLRLRMSRLGRSITATSTPHLTLLYDNRTVLEEPVATVRWNVQEFVLVRSFQGQTRYEQLGSWPLQASPLA